MRTKKKVAHLKRLMKEAQKQGDLLSYENLLDDYLELRHIIKNRRRELQKIRQEYCWK